MATSSAAAAVAGCLALRALGCGHDDGSTSSGRASPAAPAPEATLHPAPTASSTADGEAPAPGPAGNPLHLPSHHVALDPGRRVFTFSAEMLAAAKPGSTLVLYAATAVGVEGDDVVIDGRTGPSYRVHAGYVIPVPDDAHLRVADPVLAEWNGVMKHAVVIRFVKDRVAVRYTDLEPRSQEALVKGVRFVKQAEGLIPGNYAALQDGEEWKHVLLVSPLGEGPPRQWFALGFGGAARVVDAAMLRPIPVRYAPKTGAPVLAEWVGTLRKATVLGSDEPGMFSVKFERAGRPATVGVGLLMPPLEGG